MTTETRGSTAAAAGAGADNLFIEMKTDELLENGNHLSNITPIRPNNNSLSKRITVATFYGISSFLITVINKTVLTTYAFPSIQVLGLGQIAAAVVFLYLAKKLKMLSFPDLTLKTWREVMPLPIIFIANLFFGLAGTQKISLPMFTTIRKFAILMTMIGEIYILGERPSVNVQLSVFAMLLGSVIASSNDLAFNLEGYVLVLLSDFFTAANGVYMKQKLGTSSSLGTFGLMYYNSLFTLVPAAALAWATGDIHKMAAYPQWSSAFFLFHFALSCCMGVVLNYSILLCTHVNSALTTTIVGCLKNVTITYLGMFIGGDYIFSAVNFIGLNISVIGSLFYTWVTFKE